MKTLHAVVLSLLVAAFAAAAELPSWFPPANGYEVKHLKHSAYDDWTFLLPSHGQHAHGAVWDFDFANAKADAWTNLRSALERNGFKVVYGNAKEANPGALTMQKGEGEHATFVVFWNHGRLAIVEPATNPIHLTLTPPAKEPETIGAKDDIPYLAPIAGSKLKGAHEYPEGMNVSPDCKSSMSERAGTASLERVYEMPPDLSDYAVREAYDRALHEAGWDYTCKLAARWLNAHYTRNGRDIWAKVVTAAPRDYTLVVADTGAGLRADLRKNCKASLYGVNFDFNKATLRPDAEPALNQLLAVLKEQPKLVVEIGGHTDNVGKPDYNLKLSDERAAAVKQWLIGHGIASSRLTSHGYGDTQPLVKNDSDENRAKNRRVEVKRTDCK